MRRPIGGCHPKKKKKHIKLRFLMRLFALDIEAEYNVFTIYIVFYKIL